jgi:hypothetical protein
MPQILSVINRFFLSSLLLMLFSCNEELNSVEEFVSTPRSKQPILSFSKNDVAWLPNKPVSIIIARDAKSETQGNDYRLSLMAERSIKDVKESFSITLFDTTFQTGNVYDLSNENITVRYGFESLDDAFEISEVISGTLTLIAFDRLENIVRGTFEVTFEAQKDIAGVSISNGKFDSKPN